MQRRRRIIIRLILWPLAERLRRAITVEFNRRIDQLSNDLVQFRYIGDERESGTRARVFEQSLKSARDRKKPGAYRRAVKRAPSRDHYLAQEDQARLEKHGIESSRAPCLLVYVPPDRRPIVLSIPRPILRSDESLLEFVALLCKEFSEEALASHEDRDSMDSHCTRVSRLLLKLVAAQPPERGDAGSGRQAEKARAGKGSEAPWKHHGPEFRRVADGWMVAFAEPPKPVSHSIGMLYIAYMLSHPDSTIHPLQLRTIITRAQANTLPRLTSEEAARDARLGDMASSSADPICDDEAEKEYKSKLREMEQQVGDAEETGNVEEAARIRDQMQQIARQLQASRGLGGRRRKLGSEHERARSSVTQAIRSTIKHLRGIEEALAIHLDHSITTGETMTYRTSPGETVVWRLR